MCGRFYITATADQVTETFQLHRLSGYETSYNIPPGQKVLTVVKLDDGSNKAVNLLWGLIPHWSKDSKISSHLINARAETLSEKPSFKTAYKQHRCLIPATGFFEWKALEDGKQAYCIHHKDDSLMAFAGLWEYWEQGTRTIYSCSIITTAANDLILPIHQRMPVIIAPEKYDLWLDKQTSKESTEQILADDGYRGIIYKPVSDWVNNPRHNDNNCLV